MQIVDAQIHVWGSDMPGNQAHWHITSFTTEEAVKDYLCWLKGRDLELVMGEAICKRWGWDRKA